jgi:hypothetical protein
LSVSIPSENLAAVLEALKPHLPATVTAAFVIPQAQQSTVMGKIFQIPSLEYQQVKVSCVHSTNATKDVPLTVRVVQTELTQLLQAATIL